MRSGSRRLGVEMLLRNDDSLLESGLGNGGGFGEMEINLLGRPV